MFLILLPVLASAATTNVNVGQGGTNFNPSAVTIRVGDIVNWTWAGNNHSVTSGPPNNPNGIFDSGIRNNGFAFPVTFGTAGAYPYYCRVHGAMMTGTVTVVVATPTPVPTATHQLRRQLQLRLRPQLRLRLQPRLRRQLHDCDFNARRRDANSSRRLQPRPLLQPPRRLLLQPDSTPTPAATATPTPTRLQLQA